MLKPIERVVLIALIWLVGYLLGAFSAWDLNPGHWEGFGRFSIAVAVFFFSVIAAISD